MKRWSASYVIRELQIKTMRYHYTPIRMMKIQNSWQHLTWHGEDVEPELSSLVGLLNGIAILKNTLAGSYRIKYALTISSNCILWYLPRKVENLYSHKKLHMMFITTLFMIGNLEDVFIRWMDKRWYISTMEYYSPIKRNKLSKHEKTWRNLNA